MSILLRNLKEIYHLKSSNFKLADLILEQEEADEEPEEENPFEDDEEAAISRASLSGTNLGMMCDSLGEADSKCRYFSRDLSHWQ